MCILQFSSCLSLLCFTFAFSHDFQNKLMDKNASTMTLRWHWIYQSIWEMFKKNIESSNPQIQNRSYLFNFKPLFRFISNHLIFLMLLSMILLVPLSNCFVIYRNTVDFCVLTFYLATLLNSLKYVSFICRLFWIF